MRKITDANTALVGNFVCLDPGQIYGYGMGGWERPIAPTVFSARSSGVRVHESNQFYQTFAP